MSCTVSVSRRERLSEKVSPMFVGSDSLSWNEEGSGPWLDPSPNLCDSPFLWPLLTSVKGYGLWLYPMVNIDPVYVSVGKRPLGRRTGMFVKSELGLRPDKQDLFLSLEVSVWPPFHGVVIRDLDTRGVNVRILSSFRGSRYQRRSVSTIGGPDQTVGPWPDTHSDYSWGRTRGF